MIMRDEQGRRWRAKVHASAFALLRARVRLPGALIRVAAAAVLAACSMSNGPGTLMVDPGRYSVLHCKDLISQWNSLNSREQELRKLQDKASEGTGGAMIGAISYRADYEAVLSDKKLVQRAANDQNCALTPTYQSDQTIR
jgi:hypothetical protein